MADDPTRDFYFPRAVKKAADKISGKTAPPKGQPTPAIDVAAMAQEHATKKLAQEAAAREAKAKAKSAPKAKAPTAGGVKRSNFY